MPVLNVSGMSCEHCRQSVTKAVAELPGVTGVTVDPAAGTVTWTDADPAAPVSPEAVKNVINALGFEAR